MKKIPDAIASRVTLAQLVNKAKGKRQISKGKRSEFLLYFCLLIFAFCLLPCNDLLDAPVA
jgi:hypothetical protein